MITRRSSHRLVQQAAVGAAIQPVLESLEQRRLLSAGSLDLTYGVDGFARLPIPSGACAYATSAAMQGNNLLVAGCWDDHMAVARFDVNGNLDLSFGGGDGIATIDLPSMWEDAQAVAVDSLGRIVLAGIAPYAVSSESYDDIAIVRLNPDGSLDTSFGGGFVLADIGGGTENIWDLVLRPDGRILVAGNHDDSILLAQYTEAGLPDLSFGTNGFVTRYIGAATQFYTVALHSDGIVVSGIYNYDVLLARFESDGSPDGDFGLAGIVIVARPHYTEWAEELTVDADQNILLAGAYTVPTTGKDAIAVYRFTSTGSLDGTFGSGGLAVLSVDDIDLHAYGVAIDSSSRIVVGGDTCDASTMGTVVARFTPSGAVDTDFGNQGLTIVAASQRDSTAALVLQTDGKILVAGYSFESDNRQFFAARFLVEEPPPPSGPVYVNPDGNLVVEETAGSDVFQVLADPAGVRVIYNGMDYGVFSPTGRILISGGDGNDSITIATGVTIAASITGGAGDDTISAGGGADTILGGAGNDFIAGDGAADLLLGEAGNDTIFGGSGADTIYGGTGNDSIAGGAGADVLLGEAGNDFIGGGAGDDFIDGGAGFDMLTGADGADIVLGGDGGDILGGGEGRDILTGGDGSDMVLGNIDDDILIAGWTSLDAAGLTAVRTVWNGPGTYSARVAAIHGVHLITEASQGVVNVFDDGDVDFLFGGAGSDWFLFNRDGGIRDIVLDARPGEIRSDID